MMLAALLLAAACTPLPVCSTDAPAPVAVEQSVGADLGITGAASMDLPFAVKLRGTIVVAVRAGGHAAHALTASDSLGNPYTALGTVAAPGPSTLALFAAPVNAAGLVTVSVADASTSGPIRMIVREYSGLGALGQATARDGAGSSVPIDGTLAAVVTLTAQPSVTSEADVEAVNGKLFGLHGAPALNLAASSAWTSLSVPIAATSGPCETPTPVIAWDQVADSDLAGYSLFYREPGGTFQKLVDIPCERWDATDPPDGTLDARLCRGADIGAALQRYCPTCAPLRLYEFAVKAYDQRGGVSATYSNIVQVCFSPLCVKPGPCS